jgi:hypothetical protein
MTGDAWNKQSSWLGGYKFRSTVVDTREATVDLSKKKLLFHDYHIFSACYEIMNNANLYSSRKCNSFFSLKKGHLYGLIDELFRMSAYI